MKTEQTLAELREALERKRTGVTLNQEAALLSGDLRLFVLAAWCVVEPTTAFRSNWHIDAICAHLEAVTRGELRRLLINMPPRHMKSLLVSVFWPAWCWTFAPQLRFLTASYGASLAERDAIRSRDLLRSSWYQERWPQLEMKGDVNRTSRYENTATGYRIATSVGGEGTGEGGDILIIDDPHKSEDALSDNARARVIDWHDGTFGFRFNDPKTGVEVVVMQRLHERDLSGHLLERDGWNQLCLPARYEPSHPFCWPDDPRTRVGELLWPEHVPEVELRRIEETMGSFRAAGQLQQRPAALEGELLKRGWWRFYDPKLLDDRHRHQLPRFQQIVASWDTAFKDTTSSDFVVGQVWGIQGTDHYLLYSYRQRANLQATKDAMRAAHQWVEQRWPRLPHRILIEKTANGVDILAELKRELPGVLAVTVSQDKVTRAIAASPQLEAGNVFLPGHTDPGSATGYRVAEWVSVLIEEAASFPNGRHDDQVDAYSQAINWARSHHAPSPTRSTVPQGRLPDAYTIAARHRASADRGYLSRHRLNHHAAANLEEIAARLGLPITNTRQR